MGRPKGKQAGRSEKVQGQQTGPWMPALLQTGQTYTQRVLFYVPAGETPLVLVHRPLRAGCGSSRGARCGTGSPCVCRRRRTT